MNLLTIALGGGGGLAPLSGGGSLASKFGSTDLVFSINKHKKVDLSNFARYKSFIASVKVSSFKYVLYPLFKQFCNKFTYNFV